MVTDHQVRKLMEEMSKHGKVGLAALRAGMDRKTARKYVRQGKLPSELKEPRAWRTRKDPFAEDWDDMASMLEHAPELEAKALFEHLLSRRPGRYVPGQLRTFQRRVRRWRALNLEGREVYFAQEHRPGDLMQTDFTCMNELEITIGGEAFPHKCCHSVLPFSNWQSGTVCRSESLPALSEGVQTALFRLGKVPRQHQTDNSTAATHHVKGKRHFNDEYVALMSHLGMTPRTTAVGAKEQNGDVEAANGALKRRIEQHLLLRGSRDFASVDDYRSWLDGVFEASNALRADKVAEELGRMKDLVVQRIASWRDYRVGVTSWSTIRVLQNTYSVPCRLRGEEVDVRVFDDRLEVRYANELQATIDRLLGRNNHRINYRHIIWSLVRKPGAFRRYRYREDLFPSLTFRRAYDVLCSRMSDWDADLQYVRLLHLAASTMECKVEAGIETLLEVNKLPTADEVKALVAPVEPEHPDMKPYEPAVDEYDDLLGVV